MIISNVLFSQSIKVETKKNIEWFETIPVSDIIEAGNDYGGADTGTYTSNRDQTEITIKSKKHNRTVVKIRKEYNGNWPQNLDLQIRRTDNYNRDSNDGLIFQTITDVDNVFFYTTGNQKNVPIQYRIKGISVLLPVQDYIAIIIYTVYDY